MPKTVKILFIGLLLSIVTGCTLQNDERYTQIRNTELLSHKILGPIEDWSCKHPKEIIKVREYQTVCPERDKGEEILDSCGYGGQINSYICGDEYFMSDDTDIFGEIIFGPFQFAPIEN